MKECFFLVQLQKYLELTSIRPNVRLCGDKSGQLEARRFHLIETLLILVGLGGNVSQRCCRSVKLAVKPVAFLQVDPKEGFEYWTNWTEAHYEYGFHLSACILSVKVRKGM